MANSLIRKDLVNKELHPSVTTESSEARCLEKIFHCKKLLPNLECQKIAFTEKYWNINEKLSKKC